MTGTKKEEKKVKAKESPKKETAVAEVHKNAKEEKKEVKEQVKKAKKTKEEIEQEIKNLDVIKYALITEKAVNMIEAENKLVFVVNKNANKELVRAAVEGLYKVKVKSVNIIKDMKARKKAIVTIDKKFKADSIATKLGVI